MHFGHCEQFAFIDIDPTTNTVMSQQEVASPEHQPGLLPRWLAEKGVNIVIAGGMGQRAQMLFAEQGIQVLVGAPCDTPDRIVAAYLDGSLVTGENICDH